jgi:hypothetical protein
MDCDVYLTESTYQGKLTSPAAWRKVATATGRTPAIGAPARLVLDRPILLLPGRSYGVGLHHRNNASHYINLQVPIGNADLTLTPGAVAFSPGRSVHQCQSVPDPAMGGIVALPACLAMAASRRDVLCVGVCRGAWRADAGAGWPGPAAAWHQHGHYAGQPGAGRGLPGAGLSALRRGHWGRCRRIWACLAPRDAICM